jgi:hypothetical protein
LTLYGNWEIERLKQATPHDIIDMKCFAFNAAVTAWQLTDWVFEDMTDDQRRLFKVSRLTDLQNLARDQCRALHLCRQIATASKHRNVRMHYDPNVSTKVESNTVGSERLPEWRLLIVDGPNSVFGY